MTRIATAVKVDGVRAYLKGMFLVFAATPATIAAFEGWDKELVSAYYDFEVAGYCSLVSAPVAAGFQHEVSAIIERKNIGDEQMQVSRMQAWKLAHLEWQNRGLGGFRGWCRNEGKAAAARFMK